ncbi:uncharacterized protein DS421_1g30050 [Arachis hypogaea]|nr:uncharacterized protein DS421_1g30050 [Arachis hypogaea]
MVPISIFPAMNKLSQRLHGITWHHFVTLDLFLPFRIFFFPSALPSLPHQSPTGASLPFLSYQSFFFFLLPAPKPHDSSLHNFFLSALPSLPHQNSAAAASTTYAFFFSSFPSAYTNPAPHCPHRPCTLLSSRHVNRLYWHHPRSLFLRHTPLKRLLFFFLTYTLPSGTKNGTPAVVTSPELSARRRKDQIGFSMAK